ncbi:MAG TPA: glutamyl-tRNA reductase [Planctomycetota bacterium]|jgi:glutamyl-tRNA reductase|nr:glutamyl-tRNA reductase [Planctomycetota bacterium]
MASLLCLGVSHRTAPVALRERLAYPPAAAGDALARLARGELDASPALAEVAVLSTCNRTEVYAVPRSAEGDADSLAEAVAAFVAATRGMEAGTFRAHACQVSGREALRHLCRVAAGLESMVLGEFEILGQVTTASEIARGAGALGPVLEEAFRAALRAGRRARAETAISRNPHSVPSEAVALVVEAVGDLADRRILVLGSGEVARLAGTALRKRGARSLAVVSRVEAHARELAQAWGAEVLPRERLAEALESADVAICSTSAPHPVVTEDLLRRTQAARPGRPLLLVDLAVPRNVEASAGTVPGVALIDLDHLRARLDGHLADRREEVPRVERIVEEEVQGFEERRREAELRPFFSQVRRRLDDIRRRELDRALGDLRDLPPGARERIAHFSESLLKRILHAPTARLRSEPDPDRSALLVRVARELLEIPCGNGGP